MSAALEMAQKIANDKREAARKARESEEASKLWREKQRLELQAHVDKTLASFDGVAGLKVHRNGFLCRREEDCDSTKDVVIAQVWVAMNRWEFQGSDESPVVDMEGYVIFYKVKGDPYTDTWSSRVPDFDKGFGEAMARHL